MAGIEKVCEFSGEYPGSDMYSYKRNHIQVLPKYRKEFRDQDAVLYVFENKLVEKFKCGATMTAKLDSINPNPTEEDWDSWKPERDFSIENGVKVWYAVFFDNLAGYKEYAKKYKRRLLMQYDYVLHVPGVPGEVEGYYSNSSTDMTSVIRRLSRMVGKRKLKIKYMPGDMYDFLEKIEGSQC